MFFTPSDTVKYLLICFCVECVPDRIISHLYDSCNTCNCTVDERIGNCTQWDCDGKLISNIYFLIINRS